jgi:hypothetical protein
LIIGTSERGSKYKEHLIVLSSRAFARVRPLEKKTPRRHASARGGYQGDLAKYGRKLKDALH